jgi:hypothetical protein
MAGSQSDLDLPPEHAAPPDEGCRRAIFHAGQTFAGLAPLIFRARLGGFPIPQSPAARSALIGKTPLPPTAGCLSTAIGGLPPARQHRTPRFRVCIECNAKSP